MERELSIVNTVVPDSPSWLSHVFPQVMALSGIVSWDCFSHKRAASPKSSLSFRGGLHLMTGHCGEGNIKGAQLLLQSRTTCSRRNDSSGPFQLQNCLYDQTEFCCNCIAVHLHLPNSTSFTFSVLILGGTSIYFLCVNFCFRVCLPRESDLRQ